MHTAHDKVLHSISYPLISTCDDITRRTTLGAELPQLRNEVANCPVPRLKVPIRHLETEMSSSEQDIVDTRSNHYSGSITGNEELGFPIKGLSRGSMVNFRINEA